MIRLLYIPNGAFLLFGDGDPYFEIEDISFFFNKTYKCGNTPEEFVKHLVDANPSDAYWRETNDIDINHTITEIELEVIYD